MKIITALVLLIIIALSLSTLLLLIREKTLLMEGSAFD